MLAASALGNFACSLSGDRKLVGRSQFIQETRILHMPDRT